MIIVRISGGLGNQMLQYARGRALALRHNTDLALDISSYDSDFHNNAPRNYLLNRFKTAGDIANKKHFDQINIANPQDYSVLGRIKRKVLRLVEFFKITGEKRNILERGCNFQPGLLDPGDNIFLAGGWFSEKYFKDFEDFIKKDFVLKDELSNEARVISNKIKESESVSIHIRRGDFVTVSKTNKKHGTCSPDYYRRAINYILEHTKAPKFFIFSDDISWVKENIKIPEPHTFVSNINIKDYEEIILMTECQHHIIANSSFSWWGAWLGKNPDKIVVSPSRWFLANINTPDILPPTWIKIEDAN